MHLDPLMLGFGTGQGLRGCCFGCPLQILGDLVGGGAVGVQGLFEALQSEG